jgi:protein-S-isoprenylcysteine O-methyltransferase Ste14
VSAAPNESSWRFRVTRLLTRRRVALGFALSAFVLWLARPTPTTLVAGTLVACLGEAIRIWAAGHVEKSREVTRSGPYQFTRHPLYVGSSIIGVGIAIASGSLIVAVLIIGYLLTTITAAIRSEEAHLREKFGGAYDAYAASAAPKMTRAFSMRRALANREHHTIAGLVIALALLALKVGYSIR